MKLQKISLKNTNIQYEKKSKNIVLDLIITIYEINSTNDIIQRKQTLLEAIKLAEKLKISFRISKDINILTIKSFSFLSNYIINILRQLEWWKKSLNS